MGGGAITVRPDVRKYKVKADARWYNDGVMAAMTGDGAI